MSQKTQVYAMVNAKGGSGKTTLGWTLATYFVKHGRSVLMIDTDPQSTLVTLYGVRENKGEMEAMAIDTAVLERRIARERGHFDIIIIDTPGRLDELRPALKAADTIIIPIQPSGADYFSFQRVFDECKGRRVVVVPNRVKSEREVSECSQVIGAMTSGRAGIAKAWYDRVSFRTGTKNGLSLIDIESKYSDGYGEVRSLAEQLDGSASTAGAENG